MVLKIEGYNLGKKTAVFVDNQDDYNQCVLQKLNIIYRDSKSTLMFWPEQCRFVVSDRFIRILKDIHNRDIFLISESGRAYRSYDACSGDNLIFVTPRCNSNCLMCPESDAERRLPESQSVPEIVDMIRYYPDYTEHITISGGEPFLPGQSFFDILSALKRKMPDTDYLLLTNGRALSYSPFMEMFAATAPQYILVGIPIHGYDSFTHDFITRSAGSFTQTVRAIKMLLKRKFSVEIRIVISKLNAHFISKIIDLIIKEFPSVTSVKIMGLEMIGNAAVNIDDVWITYPEAFTAAEGAINKLIHAGIDIALYNFPLCAVSSEYHFLCMKSISGYKVRYAETCELCKKKSDCGGIFAGTIRLAKKDCVPF